MIKKWVMLLILVILFAFIIISFKLYNYYYGPTNSHSCNKKEDCSDVWCPYKGPALGGGYYSKHCNPSSDCLVEARKMNATNIFSYCENRKICICIYE